MRPSNVVKSTEESGQPVVHASNGGCTTHPPGCPSCTKDLTDLAFRFTVQRFQKELKNAMRTTNNGPDVLCSVDGHILE